MSSAQRSESRPADVMASAPRRAEPAATAGPAPQPESRPLGRFLAPKYWPIWLLWLWMRIMAVIPIAWALAIHERLGGLMFRLGGRQHRVVRRNLDICFPELTTAERERLAQRHFEALAAAFAECAIAWHASDRHLEGVYEIEGREHLEQALARGKGVILFVGHFTNIEICGRPLKQLVPLFVTMFGHRSNPLFDEIQRRGRLRCVHEMVPTDRVRGIVNVLRRNGVVWYAPDQVYRGSTAELVPFFGEPAMTNVATSKLARVTGAALVPFSYGRIEGSARYRLRFLPPLENFPTDNAVADTERLVELLEGFIRDYPAAYLWGHKRFKGRPNLPDPYAKASAASPAATPTGDGNAASSAAADSGAAAASGAAAVPGASGSTAAAGSGGAGAGDSPMSGGAGAGNSTVTGGAPASAPAPRESGNAGPRFTVVIPLNNEEPNVRPLISELRQIAATTGDFDLVVVDDGSDDGTAAELRRVAADTGSLRMLTHPTRRGQSTAIYNGIRAATTEIVVAMDGDLQNDPADIPKLLDAFAADADNASLGLLMGHRVTRRDSGLRRLSSRVANAVRSRILHDDTPDTGCGLKLIRRSVFEQLPYFNHMHRFLPALVRAAGFRVASVPVNHRPRVEGTAHYGMWDRLWVGIVDMFGVAWLARRHKPRDFREETL